MTRRRAVAAATYGGLILLLTGATGGTGMVALLDHVINRLSPEAARLLLPLFIAAGILAGLGGVTVIIAAALLQTGRRFPAKVLLGLGAGIGLIGLGVQAVAVLISGQDVVAWLGGLFLSLTGLGLLLVLYAQATA